MSQRHTDASKRAQTPKPVPSESSSAQPSIPNAFDPAQPSNPADILHLQRMIGNHAVNRLLARSPQADVQRDVVDTDDQTVILSAKQDPLTVVKMIIERLILADPKLGEIQRSELAPRVQEALMARGLLEKIKDGKVQLSITEVVAQVSAYLSQTNPPELPHEVWLETEAIGQLIRFQEQKSQLLALMSHQQAQGNRALKHYGALDNLLGNKQMLWRFTSTPSNEFVFVKAGTSYQTILNVIARHSGGNDKSNEDVKTLSFGRNLAALMGTAASQGGDPHVTFIADNAEYLFGIDMSSLDSRNITAHPALGRGISIFETEYVLVCKPGLPPMSLMSLATTKMANPFKKKAAEFSLNLNPSKKKQYEQTLIDMSLKPIVPETITALQQGLSQEVVEEILKQTAAIEKTTEHFAASVRISDEGSGGGDVVAVLSKMGDFNRFLEGALKQASTPAPAVPEAAPGATAPAKTPVGQRQTPLRTGPTLPRFGQRPLALSPVSKNAPLNTPSSNQRRSPKESGQALPPVKPIPQPQPDKPPDSSTNTPPTVTKDEND